MNPNHKLAQHTRVTHRKARDNPEPSKQSPCFESNPQSPDAIFESSLFSSKPTTENMILCTLTCTSPMVNGDLPSGLHPVAHDHYNVSRNPENPLHSRYENLLSNPNCLNKPTVNWFTAVHPLLEAPRHLNHSSISLPRYFRTTRDRLQMPLDAVNSS